METTATSRFKLPERVALFLAKGRRSSALRELDQLVLQDYGLFRDDPTVLQVRQAAVQLRIDLLLEWGRGYEALAWLCLETELHPGNVLAQAMKERLKRELRIEDLGRRPPAPGPRVAKPRRPSGIDWTGVAGMRDLKLVIEQDILMPQLEKEVYARYKVPVPNGILFYGPPGCGKTFIARQVARILGCNFMDLKPSDLASIYVHGTQGMIGQTFALAAKNAPTLLFFDEIDGFIPHRGGDIGHHYSQEVNEFLAQTNECSKRRILVIGATNYLNKLDAAVRRPGRFDKKIYVGPPDLEARIEAMKLYMAGRPQDPIDYLRVLADKELYSFADLEAIANEAARQALQERVPIRDAHLHAALAQMRPSITPEMIQEMSRD